jgi:hypothetical protein
VTIPATLRPRLGQLIRRKRLEEWGRAYPWNTYYLSVIVDRRVATVKEQPKPLRTMG